MKRTAEDNVRYVWYERNEIEEVLYFPASSWGSLNIYNEDSGSSITGKNMHGRRSELYYGVRSWAWYSVYLGKEYNLKSHNGNQ
jgi:hypothetical protein